MTAPPEVTTGALAARLQVDRKTLRRAALAASATPPADRDARQRALAHARPTPGGQLRWTAADAEAVAAAYGRAPEGVRSPEDALPALATTPTSDLLAYLLREVPHEEDAATTARDLARALRQRHEQASDAQGRGPTAVALATMSERAMALGHELFCIALRQASDP